MIFTLAYVSSFTTPMTDEDHAVLLAQSRAYNAEHQVTGMLTVRDDHAMQLLEGPEGEVRALFEKIAVDRRHDHVVTVWSGRHEERRFPDWSMGFDDLTLDPGEASQGRWIAPSLDSVATSSPEFGDPAVARYIDRRSAVLRRALVSGDRLTATLAIILHGHRPDAVLDEDGTARVRCAECRPAAAPGGQDYPCQTAQNAIWALEGVFF